MWSCNTRHVVMRCRMMVWHMRNMVVCCDARCEMWLWNTECCGMVWRHRHSGLMWNDGWNAVRVVWFGTCAEQFIFECGDVPGVVWGGRDVEWCAEMWSDWMWIGVIETQNVWRDEKYGVVWNVVSWYVNCCIMQDVECYDVMLKVVWNCGVKNVAWNVLIVWRQMWKLMQCVVSRQMRRCDVNQDVWSIVQCDVEYGVVWNMLRRYMWLWCGIVMAVEWRDVDCGCVVWNVALRDVVVWNGGGRQDCRVMWCQM